VGRGAGGYFDTGSGHWIDDINNDGSVVTLEDGSLWLIDPVSQVDNLYGLSPTTSLCLVVGFRVMAFALLTLTTDRRRMRRFLGFG
jgi:hypothetical protein